MHPYMHPSLLIRDCANSTTPLRHSKLFHITVYNYHHSVALLSQLLVGNTTA